jgi:hypothetical protein
LAFLIALIYMAACERPTSVTVGPGPTFAFSGSGTLVSLTVYAPLQGEKISFPWPNVSSVAWQIKAPLTSSGSYVGGLRVTYGNVPRGFVQSVPAQQQPAPQLLNGIVYSFFAETMNAAGSDGFVYITPAGPTQTRIPDICVTRINGHDVRINCKTKQPYQEPIDLEKVVLDNRTDKWF